MWARTLWPLLSSTRNIAFGRASETVPSISITPSFFGMSSAISSVVGSLLPVDPGTARSRRTTGPVDLADRLREPPPGQRRDARFTRLGRAAVGRHEAGHVGPT